MILGSYLCLGSAEVPGQSRRLLCSIPHKNRGKSSPHPWVNDPRSDPGWAGSSERDRDGGGCFLKVNSAFSAPWAGAWEGGRCCFSPQHLTRGFYVRRQKTEGWRAGKEWGIRKGKYVVEIRKGKNIYISISQLFSGREGGVRAEGEPAQHQLLSLGVTFEEPLVPRVGCFPCWNVFLTTDTRIFLPASVSMPLIETPRLQPLIRW